MLLPHQKQSNWALCCSSLSLCLSLSLILSQLKLELHQDAAEWEAALTSSMSGATAQQPQTICSKLKLQEKTRREEEDEEDEVSDLNRSHQHVHVLKTADSDETHFLFSSTYE